MLVRGTGTHVPSLASQTSSLVEATRTAVGRDGGETPTGSQRIDTMRVSGMASFMSKLRSLQEADPDRSGRVLSRLAEEVREQSRGAAGRGADQLLRVADQLQLAADTGEPVVLAPAPKGARAGGAVAEQLDTYAYFEGLAAPATADDTFFGGLGDALGRVLAGELPRR